MWPGREHGAPHRCAPLVTLYLSCPVRRLHVDRHETYGTDGRANGWQVRTAGHRLAGPGRPARPPRPRLVRRPVGRVLSSVVGVCTNALQRQVSGSSSGSGGGGGTDVGDYSGHLLRLCV